MRPQDAKYQGEHQTERRAKYGLNVALAIIAALALVILVNWMGCRRVSRFDFTSTRQYSLSAQTLAVLKDIHDPYTIVTLLSTPEENTPQAQERRQAHVRANELIDEYGHYCSKLTIEHIDPDLDAKRVKMFYGSLVDRYAAQLKPQVTAIKSARDALTSMSATAKKIGTPLAQLKANPQLTDPQLKQLVEDVTQIFARLVKQCDVTDQQVKETLDESLPDYGGALAKLKSLLGDVSEKVFAVAIQQFSIASESDKTPVSVKVQIAEVVKQLQECRPTIDGPLIKLREVKPVDAYNNLYQELTSNSLVTDQDPIIVLSPTQERVIPLGDMFHLPDPNQIKKGESADLTFQGEERITGALVSIGLKIQPLVVFTYTGRQPPLGPNGDYEQVATRLRKLNFDVDEWSPKERRGPFGQLIPPGPPPTPKPGQKAVWIVQSMDPPNPMDPAAGGDDQVLKAVEDRMMDGDSALVMVSIGSLVRYTGTDPISQFLAPWSIKAQNDRLLLQEVEGPEHQTGATNRFDVTEWTDSISISKALAGMPAVFLQVSPLTYDVDEIKKKNIQVWPLLEIKGSDIWAETRPQNFHSPEDLQKAKPDPKTTGGPFIVALAAQNKISRLIVVGDPIWANDRVTTVSLVPQGSADVFGAQFPGNSDLFINGVYWLGGLDNLIAATARKQDIRRVGDISMVSVLKLWLSLLIGLPCLTAATGIGVWLVRRRG